MAHGLWKRPEPLSLAGLEDAVVQGRGTELVNAAPSAVEEFFPGHFRMFYIEGTLYECVKLPGQAHWRISEVELVKTGRTWDTVK